eukprot:GGOE01018479.1.p1 GENE.GGOE01018479.1~~GGOE01018479.1.p1  ORF type:complete len:619 (-),score=221.83 GGOE01018479.1:243-2099(-)
MKSAHDAALSTMRKSQTRLRKLIGIDGDDREDSKLNEEEVKRLEQEDVAAEQTLALDEKTLQRIREMPKEEQEKEDEDIKEGVRLFFDNEYSRAEEMFQRRAGFEPLAALAHGIIQLIRAILSFTKEDMEVAAQRITHAERLANTVCPPDSYLTSMAKMVRLRGHKKWTNAQLRANVVKALSNALFGVTLLVQESMVHFVRAGLGFRKAYNKLGECEAELNQDPTMYDNNCVGCIYMAVGVVNVALSTMPQKILKLLSILGYPCNRAKGFELLEKCVATKSYASPFAQLSLLVHRGIIPAVAPILIHDELPKALSLLEEVRETYPRSCLHLHIAGRIARTQRDLTLARQRFEAAFNEQRELLQLKHVVLYDLAWTDFVELKFEEAAERFGLLAADFKWSKCFYTYLQATALEMAGQKDKAIALYRAAPPLSTQKFGGRRIPPEQFVLKKVALFELDEFDTILPGLEAMVLSNMYSQMPQASLEKFCVMAEGRMEQMKAKDEKDPERLGVMWLIMACLYKELGRQDEATNLFKQIFDISEDIEENAYVVPYALYENGVMLANQGREGASLEQLREALSMLQTAKDDFKDYNYEVRLGFKLLISIPVVNGWIAQLGGKTK